MYLRKILCVLFLFASFMAVGCAKGTIVGSEARVITDGDSYESSIVYTTAALRHAVTVTNPIARKKGDLTEGSLTLVNRRKKATQLAYKFMWFDKDGFEVMPDASAWTPIVLQGLEQRSLTSLAPRQSAVAFKIKVATQ